MKRLPLWALLAALAAPAAAQRTNDPGEVSGPVQQRNWETDEERRGRQDGPVTLPAWPKDEGLVEFKIGSNTNFRFYIDAASLTVGGDNVVRYTLIARSPSGVANLSYEGMRCRESQYRIYAYGQDGRWVARPSAWRDIEPRPSQRWHEELRKNYFCPAGGTILSAAEGVDALRRGGHPNVTIRLGN